MEFDYCQTKRRYHGKRKYSTNVWLAKEQNLQLFEELETLWKKFSLKQHL
jgi:hypothetical protein